MKGRRLLDQPTTAKPFGDPPRVAFTMGDVAGVGPEVIARGWANPQLHATLRPLVIGDPDVLRRALALVGSRARVECVDEPEAAAPTHDLIPCIAVSTPGIDLTAIKPGCIDGRAGRAAFLFLAKAIELAMAGRIGAITTLPLNKQALSLGGVSHPGHTEILAERCGAREHAMMLYLETEATGDHRQGGRRGTGLGVVHTTLHVSLRSVFEMLSIDSIEAKIRLADQAMRPLTLGKPPLIATAALNPHAGEEGLFGDEEIRLIAPAVARARAAGVDVSGPYPNDTLFGHALAGAFDAIVAMYHDQGHIALKTAGFHRAVNITLGLPIVRTSVAHGTAFDIAGKGLADPASLIAAANAAARIVAWRKSHDPSSVSFA